MSHMTELEQKLRARALVESEYDHEEADEVEALLLQAADALAAYEALRTRLSRQLDDKDATMQRVATEMASGWAWSHAVREQLAEWARMLGGES